MGTSYPEQPLKRHRPVAPTIALQSAELSSHGWICFKPLNLALQLGLFAKFLFLQLLH